MASERLSDVKEVSSGLFHIFGKLQGQRNNRAEWRELSLYQIKHLKMINAGKRKNKPCKIIPSNVEFDLRVNHFTGEVFKSSMELLQRLGRSEGFLDQMGFKFLQYGSLVDSKASKEKENKRKTKDFLRSLQVQACHFPTKIFTCLATNRALL